MSKIQDRGEQSDVTVLDAPPPPAVPRRPKTLAELRALGAEREKLVPAPARTGLGAVPAVRGARPAQPKYVHQKSGVEWLRDKGKLSHAEAGFGIRYGMWWRGSQMEGAEPIRSCLESDSPRGGKGGGTLEITHEEAHWIADCRWKLARTHGVLQGIALTPESRTQINLNPGTLASALQIGMVASLATVCGKGMLVTDIVGITAREVSVVESTLKNALGLLVSFEKHNGQI